MQEELGRGKEDIYFAAEKSCWLFYSYITEVYGFLGLTL